MMTFPNEKLHFIKSFDFPNFSPQHVIIMIILVGSQIFNLEIQISNQNFSLYLQIPNPWLPIHCDRGSCIDSNNMKPKSRDRNGFQKSHKNQEFRY